ncbi:hypothetical protein E8E12_003315 [Didymella heteroderae]|uniref:RING-type domain-containing protein n=1 Tax=Didymella heteroderae TaxID=1769908 RepID=A0A9P4X1A8_9PLEO|nr:hypothetical protein E8E12_003315 [Didymella heteroderae]
MSGPCPAWRPPQPAANTTSTPNLSFERGQHIPGFGGGNGDSQQSQQGDQSHPRPPTLNQGPQLEQTPQLQPTRTGVIRRDGHMEVRVSRDPNAQSRRSDRSSSPRTASRRSFDLYSGDTTTSSTSSDAEEAAARSPPASRMRHAQRESRLRFYSSIQDPNVIFNRQIKKFKGGLDRYTLQELPDVTSPTCDICAKDYSATSVQPSEDEEIAIMLPCGHVFGEFCIDQWFETCKTHKNKITCPMCRKQLVEPPPSPYARVSSSQIQRAFPEELTPNYFYSPQYARE